MKMAKAPKNYIDDDDDEPKTAPKAAEPPASQERAGAPAAATIPLEPSGGGDGEIPSQLVPYPTQEDVAKAPASKKTGKNAVLPGGTE
jgi:hypothetical protein